MGRDDPHTTQCDSSGLPTVNSNVVGQIERNAIVVGSTTVTQTANANVVVTTRKTRNSVRVDCGIVECSCAART